MTTDNVVPLDGKIDKKEIVSAIGRRRDGLQACYEQALKSSSQLGGKLVVEITIGGGGNVTDARVVGDALGSQEVSTCVVGLLKRLRFPAAQGGDVTVQDTFVFQHHD